jgi:Mg2+/Co2+ transporter CorC
MYKIGAYMNKIQVKEIMIPISNYVTVQKKDSLIEVLQSLEQTRKSDREHAHRDAIVVDVNGVLIGKVTMIDVFRALEPNYEKVEKRQKKGTLTAEFVIKATKNFNLDGTHINDLRARQPLKGCRCNAYAGKNRIYKRDSHP